jgi:predicted phosphodiesterase
MLINNANNVSTLGRRGFIASAGAFGLSSSSSALSASLKLRFGVLADIHIKRPNSEVTFEHALRWFDAQKVDAVMICGDMADLGLIGELQLVADTWFKVFPKNKRSDGSHVEKLFIYGDHDTGLRPDVLQRIVKDPDRCVKESIPINNRKAIWESVFREPWEPIQLKTVKGYKFVLYHFTNGKTAVSEPGYGNNAKGLPEFLEKHSEELKGDKPFFYAQHRIMRGTALGPYAWGQDNGYSTQSLSKFPNCVAFCGHGHVMCTDERSIWQGAFTALEVPSLSYLTTQPGRENGFNLFDWRWNKPKESIPIKQMPRIDAGSESRPVGRQGYLVDIYSDKMVVARRDFINDVFVGPDWVVPLPSINGNKYSHEFRAKNDPAPEFSADAKVNVIHGKGMNRANEEVDQITVSFPPAPSTAITPRAYDYEVQPVLRKRDVIRNATAKRVYSKLCFRDEKSDIGPVTCVFADCDFPYDYDEIKFIITPLNSFGRKGNSIETVYISHKLKP